MEITLDEIQKKFDSLPEDLKWAIMDAKADDKVIEIGQARGLNVDQMGQLSLETHMVMFGFTHPDKFEDSLKGSLKLPTDKIREITNDVNEKILKNIRSKIIALKDAGAINQEEGIEPEDDKIMKGAGIEVENTPVKIEENVENLENREDILKKMENPDLINRELENKKMAQAVSTQKLAGAFKMPTTENNHSMTNLSKDADKTVPLKPTPSTAPGIKATNTPPPSGSSLRKSADPYREPLE